MAPVVYYHKQSKEKIIFFVLFLTDLDKWTCCIFVVALILQ